MNARRWALRLGALLSAASVAADPADADDLRRELLVLKSRVAQLEEDLARLGQSEPEPRDEPAAEEADEPGIRIGGAVRLQLSYEDFDADNRTRVGDLDLDTIRLNLDGSVGGVELSAELRHYQYMNAVVHHAWVGWQATDTWRFEGGITRVPFGPLPFGSHSFFFSTNFYLGLEDDYDAGLKAVYQRGPWDLRLAFFENDEMGGIDGFVDERFDRYSYDVLGGRLPGEDPFGEPSTELAEEDTAAIRLAYRLEHTAGAASEFGMSYLHGSLNSDAAGDAGSYRAAEVHLDGDYGRWNLQLQGTRYRYDVDGGLDEVDTLAVGAYSFYDSIPAQADLMNANIRYAWPVSFGPIEQLDLYFNNSWMFDKAGGYEDTVMNVLGVGVTAGGIYTFIDLVSAKNQPFVGGSLAGRSDERQTRFNINVGYYF